jgi:hypothetical protein
LENWAEASLDLTADPIADLTPREILGVRAGLLQRGLYLKYVNKGPKQLAPPDASSGSRFARALRCASELKRLDALAYAGKDG